MKKSFITILFLLLLIGCDRGLSTDEKNSLNIGFKIDLSEMYRNEGIATMFLTSKIIRAEKIKDKETGKIEYWCSFQCKFNDGNDDLMIYFDAKLNEFMRVIKMPANFGNGKYNIYASMVFINNSQVPPKECDNNKYVINYFMNRNNIVKNNK